MPTRSAGLLVYRKGSGRHRGAARPSRRPVLAAQGRRRLVDPEGEHDPDEEPLDVRDPRVPRGDRRGSARHRRGRPARRAPAAERQAGHRVGGRGRRGRLRGPEQHVRDGVAAPSGRTAEFPRSTGPTGSTRRGPAEAPPRPGRPPRPTRRSARRRGPERLAQSVGAADPDPVATTVDLRSRVLVTGSAHAPPCSGPPRSRSSRPARRPGERASPGQAARRPAGSAPPARSPRRAVGR